jgi:hypothetical protein
MAPSARCKRPGPSAADVLTALPGAFEGEEIRLRQLFGMLEKRGMAVALLLVTLPQLLPLPLGVANVLGVPVVLVAAQMAMGRRQLWLPRLLLDRPLTRRQLGTACARLVPPLRRIERLSRPRIGMLRTRWAARLIGLACLAIAVIFLAPVPFTAWLPAIALVLVGLGMLQGDGLFVLIGLGLGAAAIAFFLTVLAGLAGLGAEIAASAPP